MSYTFEITGVVKLPRARVGVLDGKLLAGSIKTDSVAELIHGDEHLPLHVKGMVLDRALEQPNVVSLSVELHQKAMDIAAVGDRLVFA